MAKHFVFGGKREVTKEDILNIEREQHKVARTAEELLEDSVRGKMDEDDDLKHVEGKVIVKVDTQLKNSHTFSDGTKIRLEREFNEFNRRVTQPVNCVVISGENLTKNAQILVSHNALHETNRINDYKNSFEADGSDRVRYYSLPTYECYAWQDKSGNWLPLKGFQFGLRIFKPYEGYLLGIEPTVVKDVLWVTTGALANNAVHVLKSSDYQIVFQGEDGREKSLIRFRHDDDEEIDREEVTCVDHNLTEQILNGTILIGYEVKDAKPYEISAYAD